MSNTSKSMLVAGRDPEDLGQMLSAIGAPRSRRFNNSSSTLGATRIDLQLSPPVYGNPGQHI